MDDFELLEAWQGGDKAAANALFERHFDAVFRFFANKAPDDAEELAQRTFIGFLEARDRFRGDASFRTFLFAIARKQLLRYCESKYRAAGRFASTMTSMFDVAPSPSRALAQRREHDLLLQALRAIPVEHQILLELFYWEQLTAPQIAEVCEVPEGTVRTRIRRARQLLEDQIRSLQAAPALVESTITNLDQWADALRAEIKPG